MHLKNIVGDFWDRNNGYKFIPRAREVTLKKYKEAINYNLKRCPVCGEQFTTGLIRGDEFAQTSLHHISRIPPITVILHKKCHKQLEKSDDKNMKPKFTRFEVNMAQDVVNHLVGKRFKEFNGSHWVRFK